MCACACVGERVCVCDRVVLCGDLLVHVRVSVSLSSLTPPVVSHGLKFALHTHHNCYLRVLQLDLVAGFLPDSGTDSPEKVLAKRFIEQFVDINAQIDDGESVERDAVEQLLFRAAALLVAKGLNQELLHFVCWTPVHYWDASIMSTATFGKLNFATSCEPLCLFRLELACKAVFCAPVVF